jgi:hypothetical protein
VCGLDPALGLIFEFLMERRKIMSNNQPGFWGLALKTILVHTVTYSFMGILAYHFLNYSEVFARPEMACWMRQTSDPLVMAGPLFQPIRGLIFALAFFPLREVIFGRKNGWLVLWWVLVALGILSTFGAAPGSVEGMVYTIIPLSIETYLEVVLQALLLSFILFYWVNHPEKKWLYWVMGIAFILMMIFAILGLVIRQ